jgi:transcriptional regulator with XRE-family HTH domain
MTAFVLLSGLEAGHQETRRKHYADEESSPSWGFHQDRDCGGLRLVCDGGGDGAWGTRPTLSSLLNGKAGLSGEMALRIEKAFGVKMDTLMRMWSAYEIAQTRKREKLIRVRRVLRAA